MRRALLLMSFAAASCAQAPQAPTGLSGPTYTIPPPGLSQPPAPNPFQPARAPQPMSVAPVSPFGAGPAAGGAPPMPSGNAPGFTPAASSVFGGPAATDSFGIGADGALPEMPSQPSPLFRR